MDFSNINSSEIAYWSIRNRQEAENNLASIYNYLGGTSVPIKNLLNSTNLVYLYNFYNPGESIDYILSNISYSDLIDWYKNYLQGLIDEITDYQKLLEAQKSENNFDTITKSISKGVENISKGIEYAIIIAVIFIVLYLILRVNYLTN